MALRFRSRLSLATILLVGATLVLVTCAMLSIGVAEMASNLQGFGIALTLLANRNIEYGMGLPGKVMDHVRGQMIVSGLVTSELVALAERNTPASPEEIAEALQRVVRRSREYQGYPLVDEFWITDEQGHAYINTEEVCFTFSPLSDAGGQANEFWPLLTPGAKPVAQDLQRRALDNKKYLYVGVSGADHPRIIQVGAGEKLVESIESAFEPQNIVDRFAQNPSFGRILVVASDGTVEAKAGTPYRLDEGLADAETVRFCTEFLNAPGSDAYRIMPCGRNIGVVTALRNPTGGAPAALFIEHYTQQSMSMILSYVLISAIVGAFMMLAAVLVNSFLCRGLYRPIGVLADSVKQFAAGKLDHRAPLKHSDEIGELAQAFNNMADSIQGYVRELEAETQRRERMESELRIAAEVQRSLLPAMPPVIEELDLIGWSMPAKEVGGDFYDFIDMGPRRLGVAIGDATGKGLPAALLVSECGSALRTLAESVESPAELLRRTNNMLHKRIGASCRFVTLFFMLIELDRRVLRYSMAGHNPPLLIGVDPGRQLRLSSDIGLPLGLALDAEYAEVEISLEPGDMIVLFTDGLTEAHDPKDRLYGEARLRTVLAGMAGKPLTEVIESIWEDVRLHMLDREIVDDLTLVGVRFKPRRERSTP